jgi:predicted nucleic acid-binding protein
MPILDTNACIRILNGSSPQLARRTIRIDTLTGGSTRYAPTSPQ